MIDAESRSLEWIMQKKSEYPTLDVQFIEKTIRAFSLLESLARSGCPFVFKGVTACMLLLNSMRRLSVDIDIICPPGTDVGQYLNTFAGYYGFDNVEIVERQSANNVPKSHAKFFYQVSYHTNRSTDVILLDVLFDDTHYRKLESTPIKSPFLKSEGGDVYVTTPSAADLLGDKLTAFAPHTCGIPFYKKERDCSMEIIKQMFDISSLMALVNDLSQVKATFKKFSMVELGYRNLEGCTSEDVLKDVIGTALCLTLRGQYKPEEFNLLQLGVRRIVNLIHGERYNIDFAIRDAAKTACLAATLLQGGNSLPAFDMTATEKLEAMSVRTLNTKLNKLKKSNIEAFYYWALTDQLLGC